MLEIILVVKPTSKVVNMNWQHPLNTYILKQPYSINTNLFYISFYDLTIIDGRP